MLANRVVNVVNVIAHQQRCLSFAGKASPRLIGQQLRFEGAEKAFRHSIVQTLSLCTHAGLCASGFQELLKQCAAVLTASVAVVKLRPFTCAKTACFHATLPGSSNQCRFQAVVECPANNAS